MLTVIVARENILIASTVDIGKASAAIIDNSLCITFGDPDGRLWQDRSLLPGYEKHRHQLGTVWLKGYCLDRIENLPRIGAMEFEVEEFLQIDLSRLHELPWPMFREGAKVGKVGSIIRACSDRWKCYLEHLDPGQKPVNPKIALAIPNVVSKQLNSDEWRTAFKL